MSDKFKIVKIDYNYCDYLRKFDNKVCYNAGVKELRPFIGVLFQINSKEYYAPLSSPKNKHKVLKNKLDLIKIDDGKLGVININNMIPVNKKVYELFDLNKRTNNLDETKRIKLLKEQLRWLNRNAIEVRKISKTLYKLYVNDKLPDNVKNRCCNFKLLEEKCDLY